MEKKVENREELVGRVIKKTFEGFGDFSGAIESYDPSSGFFRVLYEDGDAEEMEFSEIARILQGEQEMCSEEQIQKRKRGRRPKKRRRKEEKHEICEIAGDCRDTQMEKSGSCDGFGGTQTGNGGSCEESDKTQTMESGLDGVVEETQLKGGDFCERFTEIHVKDGSFGGDVKGSQDKDGGFEGNLVDNGESGVVEVTETKGSGSCEDFADTHVRDGSFGRDLKETQEKDVGFGGNLTGIVDRRVIEETQKDREAVEETQTKENGPAVDFAETELKENGCSSSSADNQRGESGFCPHGKEEQGNFTEKCLETPSPASKRRKLSQNVTSSPVLRRSSRRATGVLYSLGNPFTDMESLIANSSVSDVDCVGSSAKILAEEQPDLPQKFPLPPSSNNLDIDELPVLDLFCVYSCLRSFSIFLFLSPFSLEAFVASLKCNFANSLIDSLHFSILQALKRHLEFLSAEGSNSATTCLRNLDWGLLDLITWPVYLAEYLLIRGLGSLSGLELGRLKLLNGEYYKHSATLKLDVLRYLCDDVLEVENIRLELDRRAMASELYANTEWNGNIDNFKKRKDLGSSYGTNVAKVCTEVTDMGNSCLTEDAVEATIPDPVEEGNDWNSDECCLCKMDGSLICCDGCPAAYHTRCLGIAKALLPEGDWYCPECVMDKQDGWLKSSKPLKGAVLLGIDLSGRLYFGCCDYLLVSDSCDAAASYCYYNKNDLGFLLDSLKSSDLLYTDIVNAISMHWGIPVSSTVKNGQLNLESHECCTDMDINTQKKSAAPEDVQISETEGKFRSSAGFAEISHSTTNADDPELILKPTDQDLVLDKPKSATVISCGLKFDLSRSGECKEQSKPGYYINCYSFGHIASSVAEELTRRSLENKHALSKRSDSAFSKRSELALLKRSESEVISAQLKIVSSKSTNFCWSSVDIKSDTVQENCGWCFSCKSENERDCLFNMADKRVLKGSDKTEAVGLRSKRNRKSHLPSVVRYILSIEDRLSGLLCGPWQNPNYSKQWRKNVLKALTVESVKYYLLTLESNIRNLALSAEWLKYMDSAVTMGSAFHVSTSLVDAYANHGIGKKRLKKNISDSEAILVSDAATRSGIRWWRGGQLSRQVFHWKALPRSLASKGARQAGCKKIPGVLYPEGSELAKRSKCVAWRAAVEMSVTVAQLGYQVRDLDSHIKWNELASTELFPQSGKGVGKSGKRLKKVKVTIRRKCVEGTQIKYLLDFGKGRHIPDTVIKNGTKLKEDSNIREKYWLDESYVPLNLLKSYEEKKLARSGNKKNHELVNDEGLKRTRSSRRKGFSHLLSRAEKNNICQCGHCNKDVSIRDAVCCNLCKGFFHKRHIAVSKNTSSAKSTYACYKCRDKKNAKIKNKTQKVKSGKRKIKMDGHSRGTVKKVKFVSLQSKKLNGFKKKKMSYKMTKRSVKEHNRSKRQRTKVYHAYWLNGLHLNRNLNDERGMHFRESKVLLPSQDPTVTTGHPGCSLCQKGYVSGLIYVGCENCEEWFHGDAFGVTAEIFVNLLGFKCHKCRDKKAPLCPYSKEVTIDEGDVGRVPKKGTCFETVKSSVDDSIGKMETKLYERRKSLLIEDFQGTVPGKEHVLEEQKTDPILDSNQNLLLETNEIKSEIEKDGLEEIEPVSELVEVGTQWETDPIPDSNPTLMLETKSTTGQDGFEEKPKFLELVVVGTLRKTDPTYQDLMLEKYKTESEMEHDGIEEIAIVSELVEDETFGKADPIPDSIMEKYKTKSEMDRYGVEEIATLSELVEGVIPGKTDPIPHSSVTYMLEKCKTELEMEHDGVEEIATGSELVEDGPLGKTDPIPDSIMEKYKTESEMDRYGVEEIVTVSELVEGVILGKTDSIPDSGETYMLKKYKTESEMEHKGVEEIATVSELADGGTLGKTDPIPDSSQTYTLEKRKTKSEMGQAEEISTLSKLVEVEMHMERDPLDSNQSSMSKDYTIKSELGSDVFEATPTVSELVEGGALRETDTILDSSQTQILEKYKKKSETGQDGVEEIATV